MPKAIITVEGLGKRYVIDHQKQRRGGATFGETLTEKVGSLLRRPSGEEAGKGQGKNSKEEFWALRDLNFEVHQGEVLGIVGRNGAGKSTLLKVLSRITEPTSGTVRIAGRVASLLEVGTGFHPELTGRENIFLNGAILGMAKTEIAKKFEEIVDFAGVERFLDTPVKRYSSGMYVRLAFAVAAHLEPEILIVDEVLAVGDADFQKKCLGKMQNVAASEGRTVLFVSHNMPAVRKLCTRGLLLERGTLKLAGTVDEIVAGYADSGAGNTYSNEAASSKPHIVAARVLTDPLMTDGDVDIRVEWELPNDLPGVKIGLGLNTSEGQRIFDCAPEDYGAKSPHTKGRHSAILRIPAGSLLAKEYFVSIGIWRESTLFEHIDPALHLTVARGTTGPYSHESGRDGLVNINCRWIFQNS